MNEPSSAVRRTVQIFSSSQLVHLINNQPSSQRNGGRTPPRRGCTRTPPPAGHRPEHGNGFDVWGGWELSTFS